MSTICIVENGDLSVEVVEYEEDIVNADEEQAVRKSVVFMVSREVLINSSQYFRVLLCSSNFKEADKETVTLRDDSVASMGIWFQVLHGVEPTCDVHLKEMWHLAAACNKYQFQICKLNLWFAAWYQKHSVDRWLETSAKKEKRDGRPDARSLLYPCWLFDHAKGFLRVTKILAYNYTGSITERNPTKFYELHLPPRVMRKSQPTCNAFIEAQVFHLEQLMAARGRLRTVIHMGLFEPNDRLLKAACRCKEMTLFNYEKALYTIEVWPLERIAQHTSMAEIIERLDKFRYQPQGSACVSCRIDYQKTVKIVQDRTRHYFDGLCLDCMDKSKAKTGDEHVDYWLHNDLSEYDIVDGCRYKHRQPTWYFSFMGRQEVKDQYRREKQKRRYEGDSE